MRRAGTAGPPVQAARARSSRRAACSAVAAAHAAARGRRGRRALTRMRCPRPCSEPTSGSRRSAPGLEGLCASNPASVTRGEPWAGGTGVRAPGREARSATALAGPSGPGGFHLNPCTDKEAASARKVKLGPFHVDQITGWEEMAVPSPRGGGPRGTWGPSRRAAPDPGGAARSR